MQKTETLMTSQTENDFQYLTFTLSGERFGIDVVSIDEIIEVGLMTNLPMAPDFVRGVVNLRGTVLPVIDLAVRLGRSKSEITKRSCIVVVWCKGKQSMGMLVDEVSEIMEIAPGLLQPAPAFGDLVRTDFLKGMVQVDDRFMVLLEVDNIISMEELETLGQIAQQQPSGL